MLWKAENVPEEAKTLSRSSEEKKKTHRVEEKVMPGKQKERPNPQCGRDFLSQEVENLGP